MKYICLTLVIFALGGCVIAPPVREEIIETPDGKIIGREVVEEPVVEPVVYDPFYDPYIEPVVGGPVIIRDEHRGGGHMEGGHMGEAHRMRR
ncbi:MAG: hypothetical protein FWD54_07420 [Endomicrobia bacterium]|nr:hypothetical protein [Endomicrobiia bacterium]MCL2800080.1 hypothetical protein [Endomicrobiia bacterium]